ncbi:MAG: glyoxylate/hydroxypyruvate reductase A [Burkholderiaceae bacterium]
MAILVAADFDADAWAAWWPALQAALPGERLVRAQNGATVGDTEGGGCAASDIDIALVANPPQGTLRGLSRLLLIQSLWAGVDALLADPSVPTQVPLARMVDPAMNEAMAETALWAVLALQRGFFAYREQQHRCEWRALPQRRADETTVAVLGLGQMGRTVAARLALQGYRLLGWSTREVRIEGLVAHCGAAGLAQVLASAQVVVNLLPLTPVTRDLFNAAAFARMPRGASLVNLARGAHVVEADLLDALDRGHIQHAVLDVFRTEPLPPGHRLWSHPRVTLLPHAAAQTDPRSAARVVARNVRALRAGQPIEHLVERGRGY